MSIYKYKARNDDNQIVEGTIDAVNIDAAHVALREMNLQPEEVLQVQGDAEEFPSPVQDSEDSDDSEESEGSKVRAPDNPVDERESMKYSEAFGMEQSEPVDWKDPSEEDIHMTVDTHTPLPATSPHVQKDEDVQYYPLTDTFRLYAGWQLALYAMVYALGYYQASRVTSINIPYVDTLILSPILLTFTWGCFLFLLCTSLHKAVGGGTMRGLTMTVLGLAVFVVYRMNV